MKMRRYLAGDMRQALKAVRDAQGPDAVILTTRRLADGVEVVAAVDYEETPAALPTRAGAGRAARAPTDARAEGTTGAAGMPGKAGNAAIAGSAEPARTPSSGRSGGANLLSSAAIASARPPGPTRAEAAAVPSPEPADSAAAQQVGELGQELQRVRQMLESQLATLAWNDLTRRAPTQSAILKHLTEIGLAAPIAAEIVSELPAALELELATHRAEALIAQRLATAPERWLERGAVVALVGPTGAGKTSAIAKLAAHWALRHGAQSLALVSADHARLGAPEQLHLLGRLLGVPAYSVAHPRELGPVLEELRERRLVLIDTAGGTARDPHLEARLKALVATSPRIETALVLAASSQAGVLEEAYERFAVARPASCILTKLDEAVSLGGTLSLLIRTRLPVGYVSDGQRIPEDLAPARAHQLVVRALGARARSAAWADEELLQRRFGGVAHALA